MPKSSNLPELTGPEKAVLLLLSLDEAAAAPIMSELDPQEVRKLREVASMMRSVPASALDDVYREFVERTREAVAVPRGGIRYLRRLATRALGESRTQAIFDDTPQTAMERIAATEPSVLAGVLENEHPQLIAAILSQLGPANAAHVLEALPEQVRPAVLLRLGGMTEVPAGLLEEIAAALSQDPTHSKYKDVGSLQLLPSRVGGLTRPSADWKLCTDTVRLIGFDSPLSDSVGIGIRQGFLRAGKRRS
jgi:flagellar motor switch protein FliG